METEERAGNVPLLTLGWRLKLAMADAGVSRDVMARELGVDPATITRWTSDRGAPPRPGFIKLWALRTGADVRWLRDGWITPTEDEMATFLVAMAKELLRLRDVGEPMPQVEETVQRWTEELLAVRARRDSNPQPSDP